MRPLVHPLDALGNPVRRELLRALRSGPRSVGELAGKFPVSRPAVSRHLKILADAGLVVSRGEGTRSVYAVRVEGLAPVRTYLDEFWVAALERLRELAKK